MKQVKDYTPWDTLNSLVEQADYAAYNFGEELSEEYKKKIDELKGYIMKLETDNERANEYIIGLEEQLWG